MVGQTVMSGFLAFTIFGLAVLYRYAPSRGTPEWEGALPGAVIVAHAHVDTAQERCLLAGQYDAPKADTLGEAANKK
ncbi:hypothetical protein RCCS2_16656 [Roseobacter sp. CCS2]|nr:hypothetical protein RCCS2_16656 [Roseobacter sp. CCS2]